MFPFTYDLPMYRVERKVCPCLSQMNFDTFLPFDGNTCKEPAAKLTLTLNVKVKKLFSLALYSTHHESKTFLRNHRSQPNRSLEKWEESFLII